MPAAAMAMTAAVTAAMPTTAATRLYRSTRHGAGQDRDQQYRQLCALGHPGLHAPGMRPDFTRYDRRAIFRGPFARLARALQSSSLGPRDTRAGCGRRVRVRF